MKAMTVKKETLSPILTLCVYFGVLMALFLASQFVFATTGSGGGQSLGKVAGTVTTSMTNLAKLLSAGAYVAGVGFALMGMLKFKAHKDNPTQVTLSQPIVLLSIAAGLVFLPSLIESGGATVWGESGQQTDTKGTGLKGAV